MGRTVSSSAITRPLSLRLFEGVFGREANYGLVVLGCCALGLVCCSAGQTFILGTFTQYFTSDLQLSRSAVSIMFTTTMLLSSLYVNLVGMAVDRFGASNLIKCAVVPYALAVTSLSFASGPASLQASFLAVRMIGAETLDFTYRLCINQWWNKRRGVATGVLNSVNALSSALPTLVALGQESLGWRQCLRVMAVVMGLGSAVAAFPLLRCPEDHGLLPDGRIRAADGSVPTTPKAVRRERSASPEPDPEFTPWEATGTSSFWIMLLYYLFCGGCWNALNFHMSGLILEFSGEADGTAFVYLPLAAASCVCAILGGLIADSLPRRRKRLALLAPALCMLVAVSSLQFAQQRFHFLVVGAFLGCFTGLNKTVSGTLTVSLFGRKNNGKLEAVFLLARQMAGALGVYVLGAAKDSVGSFGTPLKGLSALLALLCTTMILTAPSANLPKSPSKQD